MRSSSTASNDYGVCPVSDPELGRWAQAVHTVIRSARAERRRQCRGNWQATLEKAVVCLHVALPGFLNGLTALANSPPTAARMILSSGSSARDHRPCRQGDYEEMDQPGDPKAALCKRRSRAACRPTSHRCAPRSAPPGSGRPGGVILICRPNFSLQVMDSDARGQVLSSSYRPRTVQIPAPDAVKRALDVLKNANVADHPRKVPQS